MIKMAVGSLLIDAYMIIFRNDTAYWLDKYFLH